LPIVAVLAFLLLGACAPGAAFPGADGPEPTATGQPAPSPEPAGGAELGKPVPMRLNQTVSFASEELTVTFVRVVSDSRCPARVSCVWSGQLTVELGVSRRGHTVAALPVVSNEPERYKDRPLFESYHLTLSRVSPAQEVEITSNGGRPKPIRPEDYVIDLLVTRVEGGILDAAGAALDHPVLIPFGQTAVFPSEGLALQFSALVADTRCATNEFSACAHAGEATVRLQATRDPAARSLTLTLPGLTDDTRELKEGPAPTYRAVFAGYRIQLITLAPQPSTTGGAPKPAPEAYMVTVLVTKEG
jgi:hypothetical protein